METSPIQDVINVVEKAQEVFRRDIETTVANGGLSKEMYHRYLSFQYHLTKGVQRAFMKCAGHPDLSGKNRLREFLFKFALEEEPHYKVAEIDLERMGLRPHSMPLDVALWWAYFDQVVEERPFVRLGTTCVLENLGAGAGASSRALLEGAPFLNKSNTRFIEIHFHEILPHGDEVIGALETAPLSEEDLRDLVEGANSGSILYLRLARWALQLDDLTNTFSPLSSMVRDEDGDYEELEELCAYQ
ncbi:MAG: hypothetical protein AAF514_21400 [Verrucomicrobiota bacterium]